MKLESRVTSIKVDTSQKFNIKFIINGLVVLKVVFFCFFPETCSTR